MEDEYVRLKDIVGKGSRLPLTELVHLLAILERYHGRHCADLKGGIDVSGSVGHDPQSAYLVLCGNLAVLVHVYGNKADIE